MILSFPGFCGFPFFSEHPSHNCSVSCSCYFRISPFRPAEGLQARVYVWFTKVCFMMFYVRTFTSERAPGQGKFGGDHMFGLSHRIAEKRGTPQPVSGRVTMPQQGIHHLRHRRPLGTTLGSAQSSKLAGGPGHPQQPGYDDSHATKNRSLLRNSASSWKLRMRESFCKPAT